MVVHRVECSICTSGPYNCFCLQWQDKKNEFRGRHGTDFFLQTRPGMLVDFPQNKRDIMERYYSGFKNRDQMLYWFEGHELSMFKANGFKHAIYLADDWYEGYSKNQMFFVRSEIWRKMELPDA